MIELRLRMELKVGRPLSLPNSSGTSCFVSVISPRDCFVTLHQKASLHQKARRSSLRGMFTHWRVLSLICFCAERVDRVFDPVAVALKICVSALLADRTLFVESQGGRGISFLNVLRVGQQLR